MCGIWKQDVQRRHRQEFTITELDRILSDPLFAKLEYININGGEPTLRDDLVKIVEIFVRRFKSLQTVSISSNGLLTDQIVTEVKNIARLCHKNRIRFSICISLHKLGSAYDEISGVKDSYSRVLRTIRALKKIQTEYKFYLSTNCVVTEGNIADLKEMQDWSLQEHVPVSFTLGELRERFFNLDMKEDVEIREENRHVLTSFFRDLSRNKSLFNQHAYREYELAKMLDHGNGRRISCHYAMGGIILGPEGELFYCKRSKPLGNSLESPAKEIFFDHENLEYRRNRIIQTECDTCPPNTFNRIELEKDLLKYLVFLIKKT
jgi:MoaA/NifB/PqqE/SkfB family radical SAM enzyme